MSDLINCPICGIETKPDYCSDKCLWTSLERSRIIKLLEVLHPNVCYTAGELIVLIKGETNE